MKTLAVWDSQNCGVTDEHGWRSRCSNFELTPLNSDSETERGSGRWDVDFEKSTLAVPESSPNGHPNAEHKDKEPERLIAGATNVEEQRLRMKAALRKLQEKRKQRAEQREEEYLFGNGPTEGLDHNRRSDQDAATVGAWAGGGRETLLADLSCTFSL